SGNVRGVLTQAVSGKKLRNNALLLQNTRNGHTHREHSRLRDFSLAELFRWPFKTELRKRKPKSLICFLEGMPSHGIERGQLFSHSGSLRSLTRKKECN